MTSLFLQAFHSTKKKDFEKLNEIYENRQFLIIEKKHQSENEDTSLKTSLMQICFNSTLVSVEAPDKHIISNEC